MNHAISDEQAIALAREAIRGHVELSAPECPVVVRSDDAIVVTFERQNPPGLRAADFDAQITLDPISGEIRQILGGA